MIKFKLSFILFLIICLYSGLIKEISIIFFAILIHEIGHIIMILITNEKISSIEITAIGCFINITNNKFSLVKSVLIYSGGIIFNIVSLFVFKNSIFLRFSTLLIFVNLIPINPLDGYQIIHSFLSKYYDEEYILDLMFYIGMLINTIIFIFTLLFKIYFMICLSLFLYYQLIKYKQLKKYYYLKNYLKLSI